MNVENLMMTRANPWRKLRKVNQTSASFVSKIPRATDPYVAAGTQGDAGTATGSSICQLTDPDVGGMAQNGVEIIFYGVGADNTTGTARIIGWSPLTTDRLGVITPDTNIWIPVVLIEVAFTLSAVPIGLANKAIVATELFADTITITGATANAGVNCNVVSPANDTIARMFLDLEGHVAFEASLAVGSATSINGLYRTY